MPRSGPEQVEAVLGKPTKTTRTNKRLAIGYAVGAYQYRPDIACTEILEITFTRPSFRRRVDRTNFCTKGRVAN